MIDPFELFNDLPNDPAAGLIAIHEKVLEVLRDMEFDLDADKLEVNRIYLFAISEWIKTHEIEGLDTEDFLVDTTELTNENYINDLTDNFLNRVNKFAKSRSAHLELERVRGALSSQVASYGFTRLSPDEKGEAHKHLNRIRELIESSDIDNKKRNSLYSKINELAGELDRAGTRTEAFMGFLLESSLVAGKMGKNAVPFMKEVKGMVKAIARSRAKDENVALPPGEEISLITDETDEDD